MLRALSRTVAIFAALVWGASSMVVLPVAPAHAVTTHTYTVDCLNTYGANGNQNISIPQGDTIEFRTLVPSGTGICDSLYYNGTSVNSTAFSSLPGLMWQGSDLNMNITVSPTAPLGGSYRFAVYTSTLGGGATNGTAFYVTVTAGAIVTPGEPGTPTATAGNGRAIVNWAAPTSGGSPVTYTVTSQPEGLTCTATAPARTCDVTGLTNGTEYTFSVTATNTAGTSSASSASNGVTPIAPPGAPGAPTATAGNGSATIEWPAPTSGGAPATYTVTSNPGGLTCTATSPARTCDVSGLTNGTDYTFTVVATNASGDSSSSEASNTVAPLAPPGVPSQPTTAPGDSSVIVSWDPPADGGEPTSYTVTSTPGGFTCTAIAPTTTCEVTGLTNGEFYTFAVTASNASGDSSASSSSLEAIPVAAEVDSGTIGDLLAMTGLGTDMVPTLTAMSFTLLGLGGYALGVSRRRRIATVSR